MLHFVLGQLIATVAVIILKHMGFGNNEYQKLVLGLTALTSVITVLILLPFVRRDTHARSACRLRSWRWMPNFPSAVLLLLMGAALSQYMNLLAGVLALFLPKSGYFDSMTAVTADKELWIILLMVGIIAPVGEEFVFRLMLFLRAEDSFPLPAALLLSSLVFGIYHGDLLQGIYAAVLGFFFALLLEYTGCLFSCILLHVGANVWSILISSLGDGFSDNIPAFVMPFMTWIFLLALIGGTVLFRQQYQKRKDHHL